MIAAREPTGPPALVRIWERGWVATSVAALGCAAASALVGARVFGLLRGSLSVPRYYADIDDTKFYLALFKGVVDHGWWTTNPSLGAPFGQQLYDFPQGGDALNLMIVRVLGAFSSNVAWIANVFVLVTFPLVALSAFAVSRRLHVSRAASVVASVIFALLPYHLWRAQTQLLLAAYWSVPLSCLLFLRLAGDEPPFRRRPGGPPLMRWLTRRSLVTVTLAVAIGCGGLYYAAFAIILLLAGSALLAVRRQVAPVLQGAAVAAIVALALAVNLAPSLIYRAAHGTNPQLSRTTADNRSFGLELSALLLPVRGHRLAPLSQLNARVYDVPTTQYCEQCYETLGTVGDIGFVWLIAIGLAATAGLATLSRALALERWAALGIAVTLLTATVGGVSALIALFVTGDLRGWNRMSVFIAFFSLLAVARLFDRTRRRLSRFRAAAWVLAAAVLAFGVWDETSPSFSHHPAERTWQSDTAFVQAIQARLPHGAAVFELPQVPFPEGYSEPAYSQVTEGGGFDTSYQQMRGYIHSTTLRWSYGAMKGRPADWASMLTAEPIGLVVDAAAVDGFDGLWIDLRAYSPRQRTAMAAAYKRAALTQPLVSRLGDLEFFDLRPLARALRARWGPAQLGQVRLDTLYPLRIRCTSDGLELENPSRRPRAAQLSYTLTSGGKTVVHYPDGSRQSYRSPRRVHISEPLILRPGSGFVRFSVPGPRHQPPLITNGPTITLPHISDPSLIAFEQRATIPSSPLAGITPLPCIQTQLAPASP